MDELFNHKDCVTILLNKFDYIKDGKRIREDATGKKFEITYDVAGNRTEIVSHD